MSAPSGGRGLAAVTAGRIRASGRSAAAMSCAAAAQDSRKGPGGYSCRKFGRQRALRGPALPRCAGVGWRRVAGAGRAGGAHCVGAQRRVGPADARRTSVRLGWGCAQGGNTSFSGLATGAGALREVHRTCPTAVALESYPCVPTGRRPIGASSALHASLKEPGGWNRPGLGPRAAGLLGAVATVVGGGRYDALEARRDCVMCLLLSVCVCVCASAASEIKSVWAGGWVSAFRR